MKPRFSHQRNRALTITEVLVTVVAVCLLALVALAQSEDSQARSQRIRCVNNLKQIGLSYRVWAGGHNDKYPMQVSTTNGGTMGLANGRNAWIIFFVMSKELNTPQILICPQDTKRTPATNFSRGFNNDNVSYFVGLDANLDHPQMFLSGDDNFAVGGASVKSGLLRLWTNTPITWTAARHQFVGNIGLADGSVQQLTTKGLQQALQQTGVATNRLAIP